jgi:hypothetical protein
MLTLINRQQGVILNNVGGSIQHQMPQTMQLKNHPNRWMMVMASILW